MTRIFCESLGVGCEADNVIPALLTWQRLQLKTAVVTLVGIEGSSPRPVGAQMAVAEDGRYVGYLSGGCFETAVVTEAVKLIKDRQNKLIRYGKGSPYFDIKLPCGSGLDLYFDQCVPIDFLQRVERALNDRTPVCISVELATGNKAISLISTGSPRQSERQEDMFRLTYLPRIRTLVAGSGAFFFAITTLFEACGFLVDCITQDESAEATLAAHGIQSHRSVIQSLESVGPLDGYSAVVLAFHEHELELPILAYALNSDCFYVGALGGREASLQRRTLLEASGFDQHAISRIRSPIGLIPSAKSRVCAAASILAELMLEAKTQRIIE